jgi:hypothetical protein
VKQASSSGTTPKARVYRDMLDKLDGDVRQHLVFAARALAALGKPGPSIRSR